MTASDQISRRLLESRRIFGKLLAVHAGLAKSHHSKLAHFIAAMVPGKGLEAGLTLSGISLQEELVLSRRSGRFRRALRCLQALAAGADSNAAFQELPAWSQHLSEAYPLEMPAGSFSLLVYLSFHIDGP